MAVYYYVTASLPMLASPDQKVPMTSEDLLEVCRRFLSKRDFLDLDAAVLDPEASGGGTLVQRFREWERSLRNALVELRSRKQGLEAKDFIRSSQDIFGSEAIASEAFGQATPLDAELYLDARRWDYIEELSNGHYFDMEVLLAYRLKLQLLERRSAFEEEKGFAAYRNLYGRILSASENNVPLEGEAT